MYGKMQSLGSLKSFLLYAPQLSGASILCFASWASSACTVGCGYGYCPLDVAEGILPASWVASGLTVRAALMWWLDSCSILCLLIWQVAFLVHIFSLPPVIGLQLASVFLYLWGTGNSHKTVDFGEVTVTCTLFQPICRWGDWGPERLRDVTKDTK